jgi:hypothetical protein
MANRKIEVFDNFLKKEDLIKIQNEVFNPEFPWGYNEDICGHEEEKNKLDNCMFVHGVYRSQPNFVISPLFKVLEPLLNKLNIDSLCRIKINLNLRTENHVEHCYHVDHTNDLFYSAIFYLNDCNGGTNIEGQPFIESVANRLLVFPSNIPHTGVTQTNTKRRDVINIIFTKYNG